MPGLAGLSCRSNADVLTAFCSSPVSRARLSVKVSAMRNSIAQSSRLGCRCCDTAAHPRHTLRMPSRTSIGTMFPSKSATLHPESGPSSHATASRPERPMLTENLRVLATDQSNTTLPSDPASISGIGARGGIARSNAAAVRTATGSTGAASFPSQFRSPHCRANASIADGATTFMIMSPRRLCMTSTCLPWRRSALSHQPDQPLEEIVNIVMNLIGEHIQSHQLSRRLNGW